jgi:glycosyl transferase family 87
VPYPGALPFGPLWVAATAALIALWVVTGRALTPVAAIALGVVAAMTLTDVSYLATQGLRDLHLYLRAGEQFLDGRPVYLDALFTSRPADLADYPFLYPPLTLPFFAALSRLPAPLVDLGWLAASIGAAVATLRLFGVRWTAVPVLLLWPPFFQGIQVGNVAVPLGLLFALAPWVGGGLVVAAIFKIYSGLAALWLVRERRTKELAAGLLIVAATAVLTLPLVGASLWADWWRGLDLFRQSQPLLADYLYGFGLPRYVPDWLAVAVAAVLAVVALRSRGLEGLARLGLVTAVASPSLYAHGLIVALPAFLSLRSVWFWTALAITSVAPGIAWWAAILLAVAAWIVPALRRDSAARPLEDVLHPLPAGALPWPTASAVPEI